MGDAQRRGMITLAEAKRIVDAGPPPRPDAENPGLMLGYLIKSIEKFREENWTDDESTHVDLSATQIGMIIMQIFDMGQWEGQMQRFNMLKAALDQNEHKIVAPNLTVVR